MQRAQNERLEEQKCYHALFTDRTSANVVHSLYGDKDVMQLSHVSEQINKCRIGTPTTNPHLLLEETGLISSCSERWQINDR